jgi:hypothetical protein
MARRTTNREKEGSVMAGITIKDIRTFFGYQKLADFSRDWKLLTDVDKDQIRTGLTDGSYSY